MSMSYTISVENNRGANTIYAVFMEPPQFSGGGQPWMNVWYTTFVPHGGSFDMRTGADFYAWTGTVPTPPAPGVVVNSGMSQLSRLGDQSAPGSTFDMQVMQNFPVIQEVTPSATADSFEIKVGSDFTVPNNTYLVGLAKVNNRGQVAPVASIAPMNNESIQVTPKMKFYISESQQVPGEIVDMRAVSGEGATVDFSSGEGQGKFYARAVQGNDGGFTVTYYSNMD